MKSSHKRTIRQIRKSIEVLKLDLTGKIVLTELGNNNYLYLPIIALLSNAKEVLIWTRDCRFFKAEEVVSEFEKIVFQLKVNGTYKISKNNRPVEDIQRADIITNSGMIRPLNEAFLKNVSKAVIPLMYEAWEVRKEDIDIDYCKDNQIQVAGTWENHPDISVFKAVGHLAVKLSLEAGFEVYQNKIFVWSDDHFGKETRECFDAFGAEKIYLSNSVDELMSVIETLDFIYVCDYDEKRTYFGNNGFLNIEKISIKNPTIGIIHLYGNIDNEYLKSHDITVYPDKMGRCEIMTETLAYLGTNVIINLQTAGLKVGESILNNKRTDLSQPITF